MSLKASRKAQLAQLDLPPDGDIQKRTRRFLIESGMSSIELAQEIEYSPTTLCLYLNGKYGAHSPSPDNSLEIRARLKQYMDTHTPVDAVRLAHPHKTKDFIAVRKAAWSALNNGTAYLVDGPPGTQKTFTLLSVQHEINRSGSGRAVYLYARESQKPQSFLIEACCAAGVPSRGNIDPLLRKLRFFLGGTKRTLFIVDEAQHLHSSTLEVLRQLLDMPPYFGVMLAGSHSVSQRLIDWRMEQWRSRLRKTFVLEGPTQAEAREILRNELPKLPTSALDALIDSARTESGRWDEKQKRMVRFPYISARALFDAIADAKERVASHKPNGATATPRSTSVHEGVTA